MVTGLLVLILAATFTAPVLATAIFCHYINRKQAQISESFISEVEKLVKNQPCASASVLLAVGAVVGSQAGKSAKASLMADLAHAQQTVTAADIQGIDGAGTGIGPILKAMQGKGRGSHLLNNPLIQLALSAIMGKGTGSSTPSNGGSVAERLKKGG